MNLSLVPPTCLNPTSFGHPSSVIYPYEGRGVHEIKEDLTRPLSFFIAEYSKWVLSKAVAWEKKKLSLTIKKESAKVAENLKNKNKNLDKVVKFFPLSNDANTV